LLQPLLGVEIHRDTWFGENKKSLKMWKTVHFQTLVIAGENSAVQWQVPTLSTNPQVSNKTKFFMGFIDSISRYGESTALYIDKNRNNIESI
jgi:hypothetical protein